MPLSVKVSGVFKDVPTPFVNVAGAWKSVLGGWVNIAGVWKQFFTAVGPLSASASPGSVTGGYGSGTTGGSTFSTTCTPTGGLPAYTYAWEYVSGDTLIFPASPTSATTIFTRSSSVPFNGYTSVWRCKVTDSLGTVAFTSNVTSIVHPGASP